MTNGIFNVPLPQNEPILAYEPGSPEKRAVKEKLDDMLSQKIDIPLYIGGQEIRTGNLGECRVPHDHQHVLATYHKAGKKEVDMAIEAALEAREKWAKMS